MVTERTEFSDRFSVDGDFQRLATRCSTKDASGVVAELTRRDSYPGYDRSASVVLTAASRTALRYPPQV